MAESNQVHDTKDTVDVDARDAKIDELVGVLTTNSLQTNKKKARLTATQNVNRVRNLHTWMCLTEWDFRDYDWLKDTARVFAFIEQRREWKSKKSKCNQVCAVAAVLRRFHADDVLGPVYKVYSEETTRMMRDIQDKLKDNLLEKENFLTWEEVLNLKPVRLLDRLLFALYTEIPPRRSEYRNINIIKEDNVAGQQNFLVVDNENECPLRIILNDYKERPHARYGQVVIELTENLRGLFTEYIKERDLKVGDRVFTDYTFSGPLTRTFKMGVNGIRHSFASWFLDGTRSVREKEEMAKSMGTSLATLESTYFKLALRKKRKHDEIHPCARCGFVEGSEDTPNEKTDDIEDVFPYPPDTTITAETHGDDPFAFISS